MWTGVSRCPWDTDAEQMNAVPLAKSRIRFWVSTHPLPPLSTTLGCPFILFFILHVKIVFLTQHNAIRCSLAPSSVETRIDSRRQNTALLQGNKSPKNNLTKTKIINQFCDSLYFSCKPFKFYFFHLLDNNFFLLKQC